MVQIVDEVKDEMFHSTRRSRVEWYISSFLFFEIYVLSINYFFISNIHCDLLSYNFYVLLCKAIKSLFICLVYFYAQIKSFSRRIHPTGVVQQQEELDGYDKQT